MIWMFLSGVFLGMGLALMVVLDLILVRIPRIRVKARHRA